jgi:hypothetical protein
LPSQTDTPTEKAGQTFVDSFKVDGPGS